MFESAIFFFHQCLIVFERQISCLTNITSVCFDMLCKFDQKMSAKEDSVNVSSSKSGSRRSNRKNKSKMPKRYVDGDDEDQS